MLTGSDASQLHCHTHIWCNLGVTRWAFKHSSKQLFPAFAPTKRKLIGFGITRHAENSFKLELGEMDVRKFQDENFSRRLPGLSEC